MIQNFFQRHRTKQSSQHGRPAKLTQGASHCGLLLELNGSVEIFLLAGGTNIPQCHSIQAAKRSQCHFFPAKQQAIMCHHQQYHHPTHLLAECLECVGVDGLALERLLQVKVQGAALQGDINNASRRRSRGSRAPQITYGQRAQGMLAEWVQRRTRLHDMEEVLEKPRALWSSTAGT